MTLAYRKSLLSYLTKGTTDYVPPTEYWVGLMSNAPSDTSSSELLTQPNYTRIKLVLTDIESFDARVYNAESLIWDSTDWTFNVRYVGLFRSGDATTDPIPLHSISVGTLTTSGSQKFIIAPKCLTLSVT